MENIPVIAGLPIYVWGGIFALLILILQVLTGLRYIKAKPQFHKILGLILLGLAIIHGIFGLSLYL